MRGVRRGALAVRLNEMSDEATDMADETDETDGGVRGRARYALPAGSRPSAREFECAERVVGWMMGKSVEARGKSAATWRTRHERIQASVRASSLDARYQAEALAALAGLYGEYRKGAEEAFLERTAGMRRVLEALSGYRRVDEDGRSGLDADDGVFVARVEELEREIEQVKYLGDYREFGGRDFVVYGLLCSLRDSMIRVVNETRRWRGEREGRGAERADEDDVSLLAYDREQDLGSGDAEMDRRADFLTEPEA